MMKKNLLPYFSYATAERDKDTFCFCIKQKINQLSFYKIIVIKTI